MADVKSEIGELWRAVNREIHERFRQAHRGHDVPVMALVLLRQIAMEPGLTVSELARRAGTVKSHVSKMIDQLGARGFVEKRADPNDQRLVRVYSTRTVGEIEARARAIWAEVLAEMPEAQASEVAAGLRILVAALVKPQQGAPAE